MSLSKLTSLNLATCIVVLPALGLSLSAIGCSDATKDSAAMSTTGGTGSQTTGATTGTTGGTTGASMDTLVFPFDADLEGWKYNDYQTGTDDAGMLIDPTNLSKQAVISFDATVSNPTSATSGSMKIEAPFSAYNQKVDIHVLPVPATVMDLSTKVLSLWAKVDSGFSPDVNAPGGIVLYVKTGLMYTWGQPKWANITPGDNTWHQYFFDLVNGVDTANSPGFDPTQMVQEIGFFIHTGSGGVTGDAGPTAKGLPSPAVIHVDSVGIRNAN